MSDERRHHSRIAFHTSARLVFDHDSLDVVVLDISLKGALIELPAERTVTQDATGSLQVILTEMDDPINMSVRVAHHEGGRVGLLCIAIDLDSVTHLRRLVELNLGDQALLERELSALIAD
jgi:hypothetical protein